MKTKLQLMFLGSLLLAIGVSANGQGTAFTYQGRLNNGSVAANGSYDLVFTLFNGNTGGVIIAGPLTNTATLVSNGLFTTTVDFGSVFNGANLWLEIAVRTNVTGAFTTLNPRQPLTPTPYALYTPNAGAALTAGIATVATSANSVLAGNISGTIPLAQLPAAVVTNGANITGTFIGNGAGVTNLNGSQLASGTITDTRLSANVALLNAAQNFSGSNYFGGALVATNGNSRFAGNGGGLTNLNTTSLVGTIPAGSINGTIPLTQLPATLVTNGANINGTFTGNGSGVTNLNASQISSGTMGDGRLSANVALRAGGNSFTGNQSVTSGTLGIGTTSPGNPLVVQKRLQAEPAIMVGGGLTGGPRIQTYGLDVDPNAWMGLGTDMGGGPFEHSVYFPVGNGDGRLTIGSYNGTDYSTKLLVDVNGNVGIGTTIPDKPLVVQKRSPNEPAIMVGGGNPGGPRIQTYDLDVDAGAWMGLGNDMSGSIYEHSLYFPVGGGNGKLTIGSYDGTTYSTKLLLGANGNVGIGTTTPATALQVAGTVTANSFSGAGALPWVAVAGSAQSAQPNTGYLLNNDSLTTVTLPASPNPGDVLRITGAGASGWKVTQNAGQSVVAKNLQGNNNVTWTPHATSQSWYSVASSSDGSKLVAVVNGGQIYVSTDSGFSWTPHASAQSWVSVASSADGSKLVAVVNNGQIYTSVNSGVTWTPRATTQPWFCVASSSDGSKLVAGAATGQIYTSTDSGVTWTPRDSNRNWSSVASSSDGSKLVAAVSNSGGQIYTSTDSGVTWTPRANNQAWNSIASSSDGSKLVTVVNPGGGIGGQIYTSTDSGVTWTPRASIQNWISAASTSDGSKLVALVSGGQIYTSSPGSVSSTSTGAAGYLLGDPDAAIELQYIGNGQFLPISHEGLIGAY